jgi:hypothetical protein
MLSVKFELFALIMKNELQVHARIREANMPKQFRCWNKTFHKILIHSFVGKNPSILVWKFIARNAFGKKARLRDIQMNPLIFLSEETN